MRCGRYETFLYIINHLGTLYSVAAKGLHRFIPGKGSTKLLDLMGMDPQQFGIRRCVFICNTCTHQISVLFSPKVIRCGKVVSSSQLLKYKIDVKLSLCFLVLGSSMILLFRDGFKISV